MLHRISSKGWSKMWSTAFERKHLRQCSLTYKFHLSSVLPDLPPLVYLSMQPACLICRSNDYSSVSECDRENSWRDSWDVSVLGFSELRVFSNRTVISMWQHDDLYLTVVKYKCCYIVSSRVSKTDFRLVGMTWQDMVYCAVTRERPQ